MSDQQAQAQLRVGVRFEKLGSAQRAALDRYVFALMKKKAQARALPGAAPGTERRVTPRVELLGEDLEAVLLPNRPLGALSRGAAAAEPPRRFKVEDISTTGCSFSCGPQDGLQLRQVIRLRLEGQGVSVELSAKVIHAHAVG